MNEKPNHALAAFNRLAFWICVACAAPVALWATQWAGKLAGIWK